MNKFRFGPIVGLLLAGVAALLFAYAPARGAVDSWSGHNEMPSIPFSQSITSGGLPAVVVTAIAATSAAPAQAVNVRSITITDSASGVVELYNGPGGTGATVIGAYGVIANTPLKLTEDDLGQSLITSVGKGLFVSGATGTITLTVRARADPISPR